MKPIYLVTGIFLFLVSSLHLLRLIFHIAVTIGGIRNSFLAKPVRYVLSCRPGFTPVAGGKRRPTVNQKPTDCPNEPDKTSA